MNSFTDLVLGGYEISLETRRRETAWEWTRVGETKRVVLDDGSPAAEVLLTP